VSKGLSENPEHLQYLCSRLDLGTSQSELSRVYGGFHHRMWRLETDRGLYAIKQLSPDTDLSQSDASNHYNMTEAIAEKFACHGIAAIFALRYGDEYLQIIERVGYLVYPWTSALAVDINDISEKHALEVARVMAKMHRANFEVPGLAEIKFDVHSEEKIILSIQRASDCDAGIAKALNEQLPSILNIVSAQKTAIKILERHVVISHGDLDHKNVLWDDSDSPILIDWESARKLNPTYEVLLEALDWSGITSKFDYHLFEKFLAAYVEAGGVIESSSLQASFDCILGDWINWLMYNLGRSIDFEDADQRLTGEAQVKLSLSTILRLGYLIPQLLNLARDVQVTHV